MGSKPFQINQNDVAEVLKVMAVAGVSAAVVAGAQALNAFDGGPLGPFLTALLTALMKAVQQWAADNSK